MDTASGVARRTGLGLIGFYGYRAARFAGATIPSALLEAALVALVDAGLIVSKSLVH